MRFQLIILLIFAILIANGEFNGGTLHSIYRCTSGHDNYGVFCLDLIEPIYKCDNITDCNDKIKIMDSYEVMLIPNNICYDDYIKNDEWNQVYYLFGLVQTEVDRIFKMVDHTGHICYSPSSCISGICNIYNDNISAVGFYKNI